MDIFCKNTNLETFIKEDIDDNFPENKLQSIHQMNKSNVLWFTDVAN